MSQDPSQEPERRFYPNPERDTKLVVVCPACSRALPEEKPLPPVRRVYVIGSLRNEKVPFLGIELRKQGFDAFCDWHSNGKEADDRWQEYEQRRGRSFRDALKAPVAQNTFGLDKRMLNWCDAAVLLMPAGRSGHLELGYAAGKEKRTYYLLPDGEPERFDVMVNFCTAVVYSTEELIEELRK